MPQKASRLNKKDRFCGLLFLFEISLKEFVYRHITDSLAHISCRAKLIAGAIVYIGFALPLAHVHIAVVAAKSVKQLVFIYRIIHALSVIGYQAILV